MQINLPLKKSMSAILWILVCDLHPLQGSCVMLMLRRLNWEKKNTGYITVAEKQSSLFREMLLIVLQVHNYADVVCLARLHTPML